MTAAPVLEVEGLVVEVRMQGRWERAVDGVDLALHAGSTIGIVGESGSGKSLTGRSLMGLVDGRTVRRHAARLTVGGVDLLAADPAALRAIRGRRMAMVSQDPMTSLDPAFTIGQTLREAMRAHQPDLGRAEIERRAVAALDRVGIPAASKRLDAYPHQFSGGMRQRALIALALINDPEVLIADEPTTALDVTVQAQLIELLNELVEDRNLAMIFISHDIGVVSELCDEIAVMYAGRVAERGSAVEMLAEPLHPYTDALISAYPRLDPGVEGRGRLPVIAGRAPLPGTITGRCRFAPRCPYRIDRCDTTDPQLAWVAPARMSACLRVHERVTSPTGVGA